LKRFLKDFVGRRRSNAAIRRRLAASRRRRALHRALAEMKLREAREGSIWRSGKGGAHHDR
jgi:hypothetical protein